MPNPLNLLNMQHQIRNLSMDDLKRLILSTVYRVALKKKCRIQCKKLPPRSD